jgi:hypothetical protein
MKQKIRNSSAVGSAAILILLSLSGYAADPQIHFKRGATSAKVSGYLDGAAPRCYTLIARRSQHMKLDAEGKGAITIELTSPSGEKEGEPGGAMEKKLSESGAYRVCLTESRRGEAWKGPFTLAVDIR